MILIKKIKPGLWQPNEQETGAIMVVARWEDFTRGHVKGEIGLIRYTGNDAWQVAMSGGYESKEYETFAKTMAEEQHDFDFYYIEINP